MPDANNHEQFFNKPRMFKIWAEGRDKKFQNDHIYISFHSLAGASLDIYVSFTSEEQALGKRKQEDPSTSKSGTNRFLEIDNDMVLGQFQDKMGKDPKQGSHQKEIQNIKAAYQWRLIKETKLRENSQLREK